MASETLKRTSVYSSNKNVDADLGAVCTVQCSISCNLCSVREFWLVMYETDKELRWNIHSGLLCNR